MVNFVEGERGVVDAVSNRGAFVSCRCCGTEGGDSVSDFVAPNPHVGGAVNEGEVMVGVGNGGPREIHEVFV